MGRLWARLCCGGGSKPNSPGITSSSASSQPTSLSSPMGQLWARLCCGGGSKPNSPGITSSSASSHLPPPSPPPPQYNPTPKTTQEPAPSTPEPPRPAPKNPSSSHIGKPNSPEITSSSASSHLRDLPPSPPPQYSPMPKTTQEPAQSTPDPPRPAVLQISSPIGQILSKPYVDINQNYDLDKELRRGEFGITYLCTEKSTGLKYACKSISRTDLVNEKDIGDVRREIAILERLRGQPNIVEFKGAYEDRSNLHLVMEFCSGGELFDRIVAKAAKRSYSEEEAARIGRQVVNVVHVCHSSGVMHRDLRPENFLLVSAEEDAPLKATEFRLSVFIDEGGELFDRIVAKGSYSEKEAARIGRQVVNQ
ncbi:hypothetical protein Vadar_000821 [Vaccinium darrowii]|uniref:Uncharacterized protein n=1 Tax=Vaccinium darrowii TaxID=229202 RepID=A0ACB7Y3Y5_9ERIC|nr:hypothetical protein Vadar_000821 [Vaccinium darrowii]